MKDKMTTLLVLTAMAGWILTGTLNAWASDGTCADCHVMHASQVAQGKPANFYTPNNYLTKDSCLGCHTGDNSTNGSAPTIPYVYSVAAATEVASLAGGNFKFADVAGAGQRKGHNPKELPTASVDTTLATPPGWKAGFPAKGTDQVAVPDTGTPGHELSCAGLYGCHGSHADGKGVTGAHHTNATTTAGIDGTTVGKSFRFLEGITGYEAADYEYIPTATAGAHNVYKGENRTNDAISDTTTMSYFCAECHGIFHSDSGTANEGISSGDNVGTFASPWIRHPVDISMPTGGTEYNAYNAYLPDVPVASSVIAADGSIAVATTGRIVMCLSCHRAHASPYDAALRWDPTWIKAGTDTAGASQGCFACHTTKDAG